MHVWHTHTPLLLLLLPPSSCENYYTYMRPAWCINTYRTVYGAHVSHSRQSGDGDHEQHRHLRVGGSRVSGNRYPVIGTGRRYGAQHARRHKRSRRCTTNIHNSERAKMEDEEWGKCKRKNGKWKVEVQCRVAVVPLTPTLRPSPPVL
jgi:hypothetical protein